MYPFFEPSQAMDLTRTWRSARCLTNGPRIPISLSGNLTVLDRACPACGRMMYICDHRYRRLHTLEGPVQLVCKLNHCPDPLCPGHAKTKSPELEVTIAPPSWAIGWDVFCWIGHRRCSRHMSIPHIQSELWDAYAIKLSDDAIAKYIQRYQAMLAARQQDPEALRHHYESVGEIILSIDGLQPEKGHETLYVVRELTEKRVWFAEALISATADEVQRLVAQAKQWATSLGKTVGLWISDKQDAFVTAIAAEFPGVPHRYCDNHFLRDVAKPVLEADSHAKVQMRRKVRGLRSIERSVLKRQHKAAEATCASERSGSTVRASTDPLAPVLPRKIRRSMWFWTIVRWCAVFSTTIRGDPFILLVCEWQKLWVKSETRSSETWTRKKGVRGNPTRPSCQLHRPGVGACPRRARGDPRVRRGNRKVAATLESRRGRRPGTPGGIQAVDRSLRAVPGSDLRPHGQGHDELSPGPLRGRSQV